MRYLRWALQIQKDIDAKGWTFRQAARFHGISFPRVSQLLALTRLAPDIQEKVLAMTTTMSGYYVTERKLRLLVACEPDWDKQRERFAGLLAGMLRLPEIDREPRSGRSAARTVEVPAS